MTDRIERGLQADALLQNELFREALNNLDAEYHAAWRAAKSVEAREDCHRYVTLITKLTDHIRSVSTTGKLEEAQRKAIEGKKGIIAWPMR